MKIKHLSRKQRGATIIFASGRINKSAYKRHIDKINKTKGIDSVEKARRITDFEVAVDMYKYKIDHGGRKERVTELTIESHQKTNKLERLLNNANMTKDEFIAKYGFSEEEFAKAEFIKGANTVKIGGKKLKYDFNYDGDMFTEI